MRITWIIALVSTAVIAEFFMQSAGARQKNSPKQAGKTVDGDWPLYRHDLAGTGYSPLTQITVQNAGRLTQAWSYIVVNGVMYLPAANRVVALEPESGKEIWEYSVTGGAPSRRGVAYSPGNGRNPPRILVTTGRRLIALNANTGKLDPGFGKEGELDMVVPYNSVPLIYKNVVVVGANTPAGPFGAGNARAFDARTGAKLWEFSSVAQPGQPDTIPGKATVGKTAPG